MEKLILELIISKDFLLTEKIVRRGDKWLVLSRKGKKLFTTTSRKKAAKRLRQIEYFKHKNK